jgi:hypothetical protein
MLGPFFTFQCRPAPPFLRSLSVGLLLAFHSLCLPTMNATLFAADRMLGIVRRRACTTGPATARASFSSTSTTTTKPTSDDFASVNVGDFRYTCSRSLASLLPHVIAKTGTQCGSLQARGSAEENAGNGRSGKPLHLLDVLGLRGSTQVHCTHRARSSQPRSRIWTMYRTLPPCTAHLSHTTHPTSHPHLAR